MVVDSVDMSNLILKSETELVHLVDDVEPCFAYMQSTSLACPKTVNARKYFSHINYRILQEPASLSDHVRKVFLIQGGGFSSKEITAALVDLFYVLQTGGYQLRKRLLLTSRSLITAHVFEKLMGKLKSGDLSISEDWLKSLPILMTENSPVNLISRGTSNYSLRENKDSLSLANQYIENSQINLAIDTLEAAVVEDPYAIEAASLLVELYQRSGAENRFRAMYLKLKHIADEALPDCWQDARDGFDHSSNHSV